MVTVRGGYRRAAAAAVAVVTGRRSKWVVVVLGVVAVALVSPLGRRLAPLEDNSPAAFLPSASASTAVLHYQEAHAGAATSPAVVAYERVGGLHPLDRSRIDAARHALAAEHLPGAAAVSPVVVSTNGQAASFSVLISATIPQRSVVDDVKAVRSVVARSAVPATAAGAAPGALRVAVGGPAGSAADAVSAFAGIDGKLLGVTVLVVALLLLAVYRSPLLWLVPLVSVGLAAAWSEGAAYGLAKAGFVVNGMTVGILTVVVFGAGTDYALLLVARYREELRRHDDHHEAMAVALRRAGPAIATSGFTVIFALLCLLAARLGDIAALGPAIAAGIVCALVAQLAFLPALLVVVGRRAFWPVIPRAGAKAVEASGVFARVGQRIGRRPRPVWVTLSLLLALCCVGLVTYRGGVSQQNGFTTPVGSVAAQQILAANFPAGAAAPATVLVRPPGAARAARSAALATPGVAAVSPARALGDADVFQVVLAAEPTSPAANRTVTLLRRRLDTRLGPGVALVGGETATNVDLAAAAAHDRDLIIPVVAVVVLVMLGLLLRSLVAPIVLVATVLLSFVASLGVSSVVDRYLLGFPGLDPAVPILGYMFLVALGVDYNIFLMTRVREEAPGGVRRAVVHGLAVTGSVITSAGIVLAATFAVLGVLPLVALAEVGFLVAFGVLVDTFLVRSVLVPALAADLGAALWWPSPLVAASRPSAPAGDRPLGVASEAARP